MVRPATYPLKKKILSTFKIQDTAPVLDTGKAVTETDMMVVAMVATF